MAADVPLQRFLGGWRNRENESLSAPRTSAQAGTAPSPNMGAAAAFGERAPEASLNDCLYVRGEPAAD
jgi:hypothetical protein